jgi:hypothetical protein
MVVYTGRWHTVRKTIVGVLVDRNGKRFKVRFLIDSGATITMILLHSLFLTNGDWDIGSTPSIRMHGINAVSVCDLMLEAMFMPGPHISSEFKKEMKMPENFGLKLKFFVQRDVKAYTCCKQELPEDALKQILTPEFTLADPHQATKGDETLYIHGIIGEDQISLFEESMIRKVGSAGLKTTRTYFGDMIHGNSHFLNANLTEGNLQMKVKQSPIIYVYGLQAITNIEEDTQETFAEEDLFAHLSTS